MHNPWSIFKQFRVSAALDLQRPLPERLSRQVKSDPALNQFHVELTALDRELRGTVPEIEVPPSLHRCALDAVVRGASLPRSTWALLAGHRLIAGCCIALVLGVVAWIGSSSFKQTRVLIRGSGTPFLSGFSGNGQPLAHMATAVITAPLSEELESVGRDLDAAARFLFSQLP